MLKEHLLHRSPVGRPEVGNECEDQAAAPGTESDSLCSPVLPLPGDPQLGESEVTVGNGSASASTGMARDRSRGG